MAAMTPTEKDKLLALFDGKHRWCQNAEARDADGHPVRYDDLTAVAWDVTGALCRLFGWRWARELFGQLDRHVTGRRKLVRGPLHDIEINSMVALQDHNDRVGTTFEMVLAQIQSTPVWRGYIGKLKHA
jgi:hypothetical protein